jgi:hypothetical protein
MEEIKEILRLLFQYWERCKHINNTWSKKNLFSKSFHHTAIPDWLYFISYLFCAANSNWISFGFYQFSFLYMITK